MTTSKKIKADTKAWESSRDSRVTNWRDYVKGPKGKGVPIKPPKAKQNDDDKLYVQRPVGEQFRPPPPKPAGPKK